MSMQRLCPIRAQTSAKRSALGRGSRPRRQEQSHLPPLPPPLASPRPTSGAWVTLRLASPARLRLAIQHLLRVEAEFDSTGGRQVENHIRFFVERLRISNGRDCAPLYHVPFEQPLEFDRLEALNAFMKLTEIGSALAYRVKNRARIPGGAVGAGEARRRSPPGRRPTTSPAATSAAARNGTRSAGWTSTDPSAARAAAAATTAPGRAAFAPASPAHSEPSSSCGYRRSTTSLPALL